MKPIFLILSLLISFVFGSLVGLQCEFNPIASGVVSTVLSVFSFSPTGSLRAGPDTSSVITQLGQYITVNKTKIWAKIRAGIELYQYCKGVPNITGYYSSMMATSTELHQAFQKGVQNKGTVSIEAFKNQNFHVKVDTLLDDMDNLWNGYLVHLTNETDERKNWPFVQFIVETAMIPKMIEEINDMSCRGSYVAPTPGVAGPYMESMNGLFTIVTNLITAGAFTPITVGTMNDTNGVDKVKQFLAGIPVQYKTKGGSIFSSVGKRQNYSNHYNTIYLNSGNKDDRNNVMIDSEVNTKIIGLSGAGALNRMIYIPGDSKEKLIHMFNKIATPDRFEVQAVGRDVQLLHDRWDGPGFENLDGVFVSDVA
jgi:hypothetical protein